METKIFAKEGLSLASDLIKQGELLGIPTETVYGLGANGLNPEAVAKIFQAKGRPQDNPLILHIAKPEWMLRYCQNIPDIAWILAEKFWPGPLTLILEANAMVPAVVRAGLPTVGVRCPAHPLTLALIEQADVPLAAPSGNLSGKPSPTTANAMFEDMNGKISGILEGGTAKIGVESTILSLSPRIALLRAGGISVEEIETVVGHKIEKSGFSQGDIPVAPGMKYRHYAPQAPVTVVVGKNSAQWIAHHAQEGDGVICFSEYEGLFPHCNRKIIGKEKDFTAQAQQVFAVLRYFDSTSVERIWAQCPSEEGLGLAVANRLQKAAGFQVIEVEGEQ